MKQKARGGGGKVKKRNLFLPFGLCKCIITATAAHTFHLSSAPVSAFEVKKSWTSDPFRLGQRLLSFTLSFFCLFCATVWLRDARVCPQLAFRLSPHPFPKGCSFFSSAHTPSEPVGLLYGLLSFKLALFPAPDPVDYHHQCNCNHPVTWPIGGGNPHRASGWIINIPLAGSVAKTLQPQINDQQKNG